MKNKKMKFKSIKKNEEIFLGNNFFTNRHWIFSADWVDSLPASLQVNKLKRALNKVRVELVTLRMASNELPRKFTLNLQDYLNFDLGNYALIDLKNPDNYYAKKGFKKNQLVESEIAIVIKSGLNEIGVNPEYFTAFYFDSSVEIYAHKSDKTQPIVMKKVINNQSIIIGAIMPMNF